MMYNRFKNSLCNSSSRGGGVKDGRLSWYYALTQDFFPILDHSIEDLRTKIGWGVSDTPGIPLRSWETGIFKISDNTKGYLFCTFNRQWWGFQRAVLLFKWITGPASAPQWGLVGLSIPQDWGPGWGQYWRVLIIDKHWLETPERPREESFTKEVMEDTHVLKFRLSDIGRSALKREERQELCEEIFQKLTVITVEDEVHGLQLYPQKWPKSVHLSFKNESSKSKVLVEGLSVFGKHVELQDDSESAIIKVTVYDAPMGMTNEKLKDI